jgi:diaminopimelate epimerase|tara:strand:- start:843 stop:1559 length:717 start_codon:yes stop_codon:yes gene_type:complete
VSYPQDVMMHGAFNRFLLHFGDDDIKDVLSRMQGADGVLVVADDPEADANMRVFNADGCEAEQCGNGLRCVALHLVRNQLVQGPGLRIKTLAGTHECVVREDCNEVSVLLSTPKISSEVHKDFPHLQIIDMGNPNAVYWTEEDPLEMRKKWGETICNHPSFANGMNVHFARKDEKQFATCASWERGVGPTHASGTGGASVFVASGTTEQYFVSSVGGTLHYTYTDEGAVVMAGPASYM